MLPSAKLPCRELSTSVINTFFYEQALFHEWSYFLYFKYRTETVQVRIKSEGCNDPTIAAGTCGTTNIEVNGVDRSRKRRGYNIVVVNERTGQFHHFPITSD